MGTSPARRQSLPRREAIIRKARTPDSPPIFDGKARPERAVPTIPVEIPASATGQPHGPPHALLELVVEPSLGCRIDLQHGSAAAARFIEAPNDVVELSFDHEDQRIVPEPRIR